MEVLNDLRKVFLSLQKITRQRLQNFKNHFFQSVGPGLGQRSVQCRKVSKTFHVVKIKSNNDSATKGRYVHIKKIANQMLCSLTTIFVYIISQTRDTAQT